jgi:uncharacterized protein YhbP (UPF0306 family)
MNSIPQNVTDFIKLNQVASVAFLDKDKMSPYCISAFYAFNETNALLLFKSSEGTAHHHFIMEKGLVSGTILPTNLDKMNIKGIQFTGYITDNETINTFANTALYYKKYPIGLTISGYIWGIQLQTIKFTDNAISFGHKTLWSDV